MIGRLVIDREKLEARRLRLGLLRGELAERAGVHVNTLWRAARGEPISVVSARKIAAGLGVSLKRLLVAPGADAGKAETTEAEFVASYVGGGVSEEQHEEES